MCNVFFFVDFFLKMHKLHKSDFSVKASLTIQSIVY